VEPRVQVRLNAPTVRFPPISVARMADEFGYVSAPLLEALPDLVERSHFAPRIG
jgi:hypothetical protein